MVSRYVGVTHKSTKSLRDRGGLKNSFRFPIRFRVNRVVSTAVVTGFAQKGVRENKLVEPRFIGAVELSPRRRFAPWAHIKLLERQPKPLEIDWVAAPATH